MSELDINSLTEKTPEVVKLKAALTKAVGQDVAIVNIEKGSRKTGVSVRPVTFVLGDSQSVSFLVRQGGDIYRVQINGKDFPFNGDLSLRAATDKSTPVPRPTRVTSDRHSNVKPAEGQYAATAVRDGGAGYIESKTFQQAIQQIADAIRNGAAAFYKKQQAIKVKPEQKKDENGRVAPQNTTQMLKKIVADEAELDAVIAQKTEQRDILKNQLDQKLAIA